METLHGDVNVEIKLPGFRCQDIKKSVMQILEGQGCLTQGTATFASCPERHFPFVIFPVPCNYYGKWLARATLRGLIERLHYLCREKDGMLPAVVPESQGADSNTSSVAPTICPRIGVQSATEREVKYDLLNHERGQQTWGFLLVEPYVLPQDLDLFMAYHNIFMLPARRADKYLVEHIKVYANTSMWGDDLYREAVNSIYEHLAFRIVLVNGIGRMLSGFVPEQNSFSTFPERLLNRIRKTPRWFFEYYLRFSLIHQSGVIATEFGAPPDVKHVKDAARFLSGLTKCNALAHDVVKVYYGWESLFMLRLSELWQVWKFYLLRHPFPWQTRIVYDALQSFVSREMLFRSTEDNIVTTPYVLDHDEGQRQEFLRIFRVEEPCIISEDFPKWFRARLREFNEGHEDNEYFKPKWREQLAKHASALNDSYGIDWKVLFAYSVFDFAQPEARRIPPYATRLDAVEESKNVATAYVRFLRALEGYFDDACADLPSLYLSAGAFIKEISRYRGRRELLGRIERLFYQCMQRYLLWATAKKRKEIRDYVKDSAEALPVSSSIYSCCIDEEGYKRHQVEKKAYDGPFYVVRMLSADMDELLESVLARIICTKTMSGFTRIIGIGRKGSIVGSLVSLTTGLPFSTTTLRPRFDASPFIPPGRALVIDDSAKSGFTLLNTAESLRKAFGQRHVECQVICRIKDDREVVAESQQVQEKLAEMQGISDSANALLTCLADNDHIEELIESEEGQKHGSVKAIRDLLTKHVALANRDLDVISEQELQWHVRSICACGLPHDYRQVGKEWRSVSLLFCSLLSKVIALLVVRKSWRARVASRLWNYERLLLTESGAKYKTSRMFNYPELMWLTGAWFWREVAKTFSDRMPNVMVINSQLAVPVAMAMYMCGRYSKRGPKARLHVLLMSDDAEDVSGLDKLLRDWNERERELRVISVTSMTAHREFESRASKKLKEEVESKGFSVKKLATCSLFDVRYAADVGETDDLAVLGDNHISLVKLPLEKDKLKRPAKTILRVLRRECERGWNKC